MQKISSTWHLRRLQTHFGIDFKKWDLSPFGRRLAHYYDMGIFENNNFQNLSQFLKNWVELKKN